MKKRKTQAAILIIESVLIILVMGAADYSSPAFSPLGSDIIENPSLELSDTADAEKPMQWSNNSWGNNEAVFSYLDTGYTGGRSVRAEVTSYEDGDAKWYFDPVELAPGDYIFSNNYCSDVDTRVVAAIHTDSGEIKYIDLPDAPRSEDWNTYEACFAMPGHGQELSVYHLLSREGYLITDNYSIRPYRYTGFHRGLVTITFDDGWEENVTTALPIMKEFRFRSNQFYATTFIENPRVPNARDILKLFKSEGHEIGSHSVTHARLTELAGDEVTAELAGSQAFLEEYLGMPSRYFATPYGAYNPQVRNSIMEHYAAHRTVDRGFNSQDNFDVSRLKCQSVLDTTTPEQIAQWVEKAKKERLWLILLYHKVTDDPKRYDTSPEVFCEHMRVIRDAGIPVVTMSEALAELRIQRAPYFPFLVGG